MDTGSSLFFMCFACFLSFNIVSGGDECKLKFFIVPQNATVLEGTIHTFECAINDPNFTPLWFVDKTNAYFERVTVRGFTSHYINDTYKRLTALASLRNNNSSIDCIAVRRPGKGSFCRFDTERVYLTVKALSSLVTTNVGPVTAVSITPSSCSTASSCLSDTNGVVSYSLPIDATNSRTASHSVLIPQHSPVPLQPSPWTSRGVTTNHSALTPQHSVWTRTSHSPVPPKPSSSINKATIAASLVSVIVAVICLSALLLLGIKKWRKKVLSVRDPPVSSNVLYEFHKTIMVSENPAYDTLPTYETVPSNETLTIYETLPAYENIPAQATPLLGKMDSPAEQAQAPPDEHLYEKLVYRP